MRFLIDNALSPSVADSFRLAGFYANLPGLLEALEKGSIIVFDQNRVRIRSLPISS